MSISTKQTAQVDTDSHLPLADRADIEELRDRIQRFQTGQEDEERFKHYRLTRGVYGQRQSGVQMFRTKLPYGKVTPDQFRRMAELSETYTNGNLHITTRQNIQMHHVKLQDSVAIWEGLCESGLTAREACGNTVRNITASAMAGVDPEEPFDVTPYVHATFDYFLRNPICQDMGRKVKIAFSSSERDSAYTYFHDFGFIPRLRAGERGFKVIVGGGLGAVSMVGQVVEEFMSVEDIIPFMEAGIRVFDRYGERQKRMKARMKFLVKKLGLDGFLELIHEEWPALAYQKYPIEALEDGVTLPPEVSPVQRIELDPEAFALWKSTNVVAQKQPGWYAVQIRVPLGDVSADQARLIADLVDWYAAPDIRFTVNQGILLRFIRAESLPHVYQALQDVGFAEPGFDSTADVTACPGTDTCALGVTNSTGLAARLSKLVQEEYPDLLSEQNLKIKISGCMNACGQHMAANIGFHGSSIKQNNQVIPAMQVVLGGGVDPTGKGFIGQKVIKVPTKRIPDVLRSLLDDFDQHGAEQEYYNDYVLRQGKKYFYQFLKPLAHTQEIAPEELIDWGQTDRYEQSIGVGECAGVVLDMVGTILGDAEGKIEAANQAMEAEDFAAAIYHSYTGMIIAAKALLLSKDVACNTHKGILTDFDTHFIQTEELALGAGFVDYVLRMKHTPPEQPFARNYHSDAAAFVKLAREVRRRQVANHEGQDKLVIENYYKA